MENPKGKSAKGDFIQFISGQTTFGYFHIFSLDICTNVLFYGYSYGFKFYSTRVDDRMGVKYFVGCALKMQWQSIRSFQWIKIIVSWSIILNFLTSKYLFPIDDDKRQKIYDIIRKTIMRKIL